MVGRVEEGQLLGIETERDSSKREKGKTIFEIGFFFGLSQIGGSCSLGEHGTMKVVGRVRRGVIVYRRPTW